MRKIKEKTIKELISIDKYRVAEQHLLFFISELRKDEFNSATELKNKYGNASILNNKRVIFNIKGNEYRLIVDIEYKLKIVFIVWFGTHEEYNKIDAKNIRYEN